MDVGRLLKGEPSVQFQREDKKYVRTYSSTRDALLNHDLSHVQLLSMYNYAICHMPCRMPYEYTEYTAQMMTECIVHLSGNDTALTALCGEHSESMELRVLHCRTALPTSCLCYTYLTVPKKPALGRLNLMTSSLWRTDGKW